MERSAAVTAVNRVTSGKMFVLASVLSGADQREGDMAGDSDIRVEHFRHHHTLHTHSLTKEGATIYLPSLGLPI